jgi:hypothetical protein
MLGHRKGTGSLWQAVLAASLVWSGLGCSQSESTITLPAEHNANRNRSVTIEAGTCLRRGQTPVACTEAMIPPDALRVADLRGGNGTVQAALDDDNTETFLKNFGTLTWLWHRLPVGYGCAATLHGVFNDPDGKANPEDIFGPNYKLAALESLYKSAVDAGAAILWTAAYDYSHGPASAPCTYVNGEQKGTPIKDPVKWAKVVRRIIQYFDEELPKVHKTECAAIPKGQKQPYYCTHHLYNVEFMRDPFGAGGYDAANPASRQAWLKAFDQFAVEIRSTWPIESNTMVIVGPSVVINSLLEADPGKPTRSPIFDFIDHLATTKVTLPGKGAVPVPLDVLSYEIVAASPFEAAQIALAVRNYADQKGVKAEKGQFLPSTGKTAAGTEPIPMMVSDLRPIDKASLPDGMKTDKVRMATWRGAFYAATRILLQGAVDYAIMTDGPRFPTKEKSATPNATDLRTSARASDNFWFDDPAAPNGSLKPGAWSSFWFAPGYLLGRAMVAVSHGPDPAGTTGKAPTSDPSQGLVVLATKEQCVNEIGAIVDCNPGADENPQVTAGRKRKVRVMIADMNAGSGSNDVVEHNLRIEVSGIATDAKTVGVKWAYFGDGVEPSWEKPSFNDDEVIDAKNGKFSFTVPVAVPSIHYLEFLY